MELAATRLVSADANHYQDDDELIDEARGLEAEQRYQDASYGAKSRTEALPDTPDFRFSTRIPSARLEMYEQDTHHVKKRKRRKWWRRAMINLLFVALWCVWYSKQAIPRNVTDKWMFSPQHYGFSYPLFVTTFHMLIQFCLSGAVLSLIPRFRPKANPTSKEFATKAGPCGVATGMDIGLSNLALKSVTLSFYTMCKSSSLGFVLLFAFLFRLEKPTWRLCGIIALITIGVILMVSGETQFSLIGMIEVMSASCLSGLRWALTQMLLDKEAMGLNNPFATLFWLTPIMAATLAICSLLMEGPFRVFEDERFWGSIAATLKTALLICAPGFLAFCMTTSEFALIQRTSVVTLSVAGIFKETATIFLSTLIFKDELTPINISGLCISIFGIALYNYLKYQEFVRVKPAGNAEPKDGEFQTVPTNDEGHPYSSASPSRSNLQLYNPADATDESTVLFAADEPQHVLDNSDEEYSEDEGKGFKKDNEPLGEAIEGFREGIQSDLELKRLDAEEDVLEHELDSYSKSK